MDESDTLDSELTPIRHRFLRADVHQGGGHEEVDQRIISSHLTNYFDYKTHTMAFTDNLHSLLTCKIAMYSINAYL